VQFWGKSVSITFILSGKSAALLLLNGPEGADANTPKARRKGGTEKEVVLVGGLFFRHEREQRSPEKMGLRRRRQNNGA